MEIIGATQNKHKIREINAITSRFGMNVISRKDAGIPDFEIEENGDTFEENSYLKAKGILDYAIKNNMGKPVIADDSGIEVDYLNGEPGVYSARYANVEGKEADAANNSKLLKELEGVSKDKRTARFVSVITMVFPNGQKIVARGECEGIVATELMGDNGFGYDPLFIPSGYNNSYAQIDPEEKNRISHRAKALEKLSAILDNSNIE